MSTYLYLECLDHRPPVRSDGEVGQHLYDLDDVRKLIANKHLVISVLNAELPIDWESHYASTTARFLLQHPQCRIRIHDEYGVDYPIIEEFGPAKERCRECGLQGPRL